MVHHTAIQLSTTTFEFWGVLHLTPDTQEGLHQKERGLANAVQS